MEPRLICRLLPLLAALSLAGAGAAAATVKFIVPSAATAESSRLYAQLLQEFEREEPGIHVEFVPLKNWDDVIGSVQALPPQGRAAVVVAEVSETLELERLGLIKPFGEVAARFGDGRAAEDAFVPEFLGNSYCQDGRLCGPPFVRSVPVAFYNLDLLAGANADNLPATWSELEALLVRARAQLHRPPFCFGGDWYDYLFEATVRQSGGTLVDPKGRPGFDTPAAVEALGWWKRLKDRQLLVRMNSWKATLNGFVAGYCAVTWYSSGGLETVRGGARFNWIADALPRNRTAGVAVGGGNLYLTAGQAEADERAAYKLARFLFRPAVQARIAAATGFFPVVPAAFADPAMRARLAEDPALVRIQRELPAAGAKLMSRDNLAVRAILKRAIDAALDQGVAPAAALRAAQREVERLP
jgi:ABC-type glycerol-3-phosphate transport system substrate-binding protein